MNIGLLKIMYIIGIYKSDEKYIANAFERLEGFVKFILIGSVGSNLQC
jgi:hypothetical protein